jgi:hypothetical protein
VQEKWNAFAVNDSDRLNRRPSPPHSLGCRATPGRGAAKDWTRDIGEDGGVMEPSERESNVPFEELDHPCDETGLRLDPDSLF